MKTVVVRSNASILDHAMPALILVLRNHGMLILVNALRAIMLLKLLELPKPEIIYYNKFALLFGWNGVALHLFHDNHVYVQTICARNKDTLIECSTVSTAIKTCRNILWEM